MARVEVVISGSKVLPVGTKLGELQNVNTDSVQDGQSIIYNASTQEFEAGDTGTQLEVQDDGSQVVSNAATLNFKGGGVKADQVGSTNEVDVSVTDEYVFLPVRNTTGSTLTKGTAVKLSGASGSKVLVDKALSSAHLNSGGNEVVGLIWEDLSNNSDGFVITNGVISGVDTSSFNEGDAVYVSTSTAGELTNVKPTTEDRLLVGYVETSQVNGEILVNVRGAIHIDDISGIKFPSGTPTDNSVFYYDSGTGLIEVAPLDLSQVSDSANRKAVKHKEINIEAARFGLLNTEPLEIDPTEGIYQIHSAVLFCQDGVSGGSAGNSPNIYIQMGGTYNGSSRLKSLSLDNAIGFATASAKQFITESEQFKTNLGLYLSADVDPDNWISNYKLIINYYVS